MTRKGKGRANGKPGDILRGRWGAIVAFEVGSEEMANRVIDDIGPVALGKTLWLDTPSITPLIQGRERVRVQLGFTHVVHGCIEGDINRFIKEAFERAGVRWLNGVKLENPGIRYDIPERCTDGDGGVPCFVCARVLNT